MKVQFLGIALAMTAVCFATAPASASFGPGRDQTFSEIVDAWDTVVFAKCLTDSPGKTRVVYEVLEIVKQPKGAKEWTAIELKPAAATKVGELFLLYGDTIEDGMTWGKPREFSRAALAYLKDLPDLNDEPVLRLAYFLRFQQDSDKIISSDAFTEFSLASYADIAKLRHEFSRDKVRTWLEDPKLDPSQLSLYGTILGYCGRQSDAEFLERKILEPVEDHRQGIDGVMSGYLLLTGASGLRLLDIRKVGNPNEPLHERNSALQAVRFMWQYGDNKIEVDALRQSMRLLLEQPELADLAISDLARMKGWAMQDRVVELYDCAAVDVPSVKRAIVRFTFAATKDVPSTSIPEPPHVTKAQQYLTMLEQRDLKNYRDAVRFFKR